MTPEAEYTLKVAGIAMLIAAGTVDLVLGRRSRTHIYSIVVPLSVSVLLLCLAIVTRWIREEQGPFLTLYDVLLSNLFSLSLIFIFIYSLVPRLRVTSVVVLPVLVILGLWLMKVPSAAEPLPATFDNPWLWLHVASGKIFLGLCLVAAAAASQLLLHDSPLTSGFATRGLDPLAVDAALWPLFSLAFICHTFMLIAGAAWAYSAWGRYWAWDPLETWTLITWLVIGLILHLRVTYRTIPRQVTWSAVVVVFVLAFLTFFGIPFLSSAPHKGVM